MVTIVTLTTYVTMHLDVLKPLHIIYQNMLRACEEFLKLKIIIMKWFQRIMSCLM